MKGPLIIFFQVILSLSTFGQYFDCQGLIGSHSADELDSIYQIDVVDCPELLEKSLLSKTSSLRIAAADLLNVDLCDAPQLKDLYLNGPLKEVPECIENLVVLSVLLDTDSVPLWRKRFENLKVLSLTVNNPVLLDSLIANLRNFPKLESFWLYNYTEDLHRLSDVLSLDRLISLTLVTETSYYDLPDSFASESLQELVISMDYDYAIKIDWKTRFPNLEDITIYTSRVENFRDGFENLAGVESIKIGVNLNLNLEDDLKIWDDLQRDVWYLRAEYDVDVVLTLAR